MSRGLGDVYKRQIQIDHLPGCRLETFRVHTGRNEHFDPKVIAEDIGAQSVRIDPLAEDVVGNISYITDLITAERL